MSRSNTVSSQRSDHIPTRTFVRMSQHVESTPESPKPAQFNPPPLPPPAHRQHSRRRPMIFVIYYSTYGHVAKLASTIRTAVERTGCDCRLFQVAETLSNEVLTKMHAPAKNPDVPIIQAAQLPQADGLLFGMPTRFGTVPTQMKNLFDACGSHWQSDALVGKPAGVFFSTATLGGGQETTALSCVPFFTHLGMIFVPLGYRNKSLMNLDEVHGGSPYGAGTLAGTQGERQPSALELQLAESQGIEFAKLVQKLSLT